MINLHALICANLTSAALMALGFLFHATPLVVFAGFWYTLASIFCLASFTVYKDTVQGNTKRLDKMTDSGGDTSEWVN